MAGVVKQNRGEYTHVEAAGLHKLTKLGVPQLRQIAFANSVEYDLGLLSFEE